MRALLIISTIAGGICLAYGMFLWTPVAGYITTGLLLLVIAANCQQSLKQKRTLDSVFGRHMN